MEGIQKQVFQTILQARHPSAGPVEETISTSPGSECAICGGTGWQMVEVGDSTRCKRCQCIKARVSREKLTEIPERFRDSTFENYHAKNSKQERAHALMQTCPEGSCFLHGPYGCGKTHLLYAQYRSLVLAGIPCNARTSTELISEFQRMEFDSDFRSPVFSQIRSGKRYHLLWDDVDKFKMTDFRSQGLFDLIDTVYRNNLTLTLTSNFTLKELVDLEKLHPSLVRRIDEICKVVEV
jgi:DNA replication protein DnaC